ncbi:hypothetical protein [Sphingopyxis terrae]|uniref:hypothetical protein n=1 Tax=Sphingopyxis terrae TaxID=33052 RepID=UPI003620EAEC
MTASEIAAYLLGKCALLEHFDAYMFGSTLHGVGQDIDILIVGPGGDLLAQLKKEIDCAGKACRFTSSTCSHQKSVTPSL